MINETKQLASDLIEFLQKYTGKQDIVNSDTKVAVPILKSTDELKREVTFVYYEPDVLDKHGQWCSKETLAKACENFNLNLEKGVVKTNLFHSKDENGNVIPTDSYSVIKSWINEVDCIIGDQAVTEGTWLVKTHISNDILWDMHMDGTVSGVSFGAKGKVGH